MTPPKYNLFGPFRFDSVNECLWRGKQPISLTPKAFAMLRYLVEHPGRLVTKDELLDAVWPDVSVSEGVLKFCMREIRKALGDDPQAPQFIETLHRRGYRFVAKISNQKSVASGQHSGVNRRKFEPAPSTQHPAPNLVGREVELTQLHRWLEKASSGERQVVFITGEPGIGKTTLVDTFLQQMAADGAAWIGRGQCIEHYGAGEAYMPVLEALGRLCREPRGQHFIELLARHAPTWLVQMPALLRDAELEALQRKVLGTTQERMLREMAEAVEALTGVGAVREPSLLVLVLEDLQWSDYSTLELIAALARRRGQARLVVIGTHRPVEMLGTEHPLRAITQELQLHGQCKELQLGLLTEAAVKKYLVVRFPVGVGAWNTASLQELAHMIYQRTDGNPLFLVNVVDYLVAQDLLMENQGQRELRVRREGVQVGVPASIRQMIAKQIERLSPEEQRVLEVASVAGAEFSAAAVAAGVETDMGEIEERCEALARRDQFLRASGASEWPDGTVAARYSFLHALYQEVLYERVTAGRRRRFHQRIGEREEAAYGAQAREIAAELAMHFERGRDCRRAVRYLQQAGENALRRSAHREAINHLTKGLELLKTFPDTPERAEQELVLQVTLGPPLISPKGYGVPEVEHAYTRARELCRQVGETPQLFPALLGLSVFHMVRAEYRTARELGERCLHLAQSVQDPALITATQSVLGLILCNLGEITLARANLEQGIPLYDSQQPRYWLDHGVGCLSSAAWVLWLLGYPDQACKRSQEALTLAQELSHPFSLGFALFFASGLHQLRREARATQERAEAAITLSTEQGFPTWLANGTILRGWALAEQGRREEEIAQIREGLAAHRAMGEELLRPYFLALLAEAYGKVEQAEEGLTALAEALMVVEKTEERYYEAELYRLKGELTLAQSSVQSLASSVKTGPGSSVQGLASEAEECFWKAIEIARRQQAKPLELRAVMSLSRLWQRQGKKKKARQMLAEIYGWFTEGFDTADLQEAKAMLEKLA